MKGILIDPNERTVTEVDVTVGDWRAIVEVLGCSYMDVVPLTPSESLIIDDEGRLSYPHPHGYFAIRGNVFCGRGLILGQNSFGETIPTRFNVEQITAHVEWPGTPEESEVEPSITVTEWE